MGDPLHPPRVTWVKGKWNEITAGDKFGVAGTETEHTLTFKSQGYQTFSIDI